MDNMIISKENGIRYPNLNTVLMVENFFLENRDSPIEFNNLRKELPKQVMATTLKIILEYLWRSGKIIYGPRGIQWIFVNPKHLDTMLEDSLEL